MQLLTSTQLATNGSESGGGRVAVEPAATAQNWPLDPDLLAIIDAWPALPSHIKAAMLSLRDAAAVEPSISAEERASLARRRAPPPS